MSVIDIVLLVIIISATLYGLLGGFIKRLSQLIGLLGGIWVASLLYMHLSQFVLPYIHWPAHIVESLAFIIILTIGSAILAYGSEKILSVIKIIPFAGVVDRFLGAVTAGALTIITLSLLFITLQSIPVAQKLVPKIKESQIASYIIEISNACMPQVIKAVQIISTYISQS